MRIEELSDGQKTVMLAELANMTPDVMNSGVLCVNLYNPANMALAWRALNWADDQKFGRHSTDLEVYAWWERFLHNAPSLSSADAQRAWLDRILSLAIEAGMVADE